jgi:beta-lactamase superfamily II metal-dependent hydrolase
MHTVTFFPLGNADSCLIETESGQALLFDFADVDDPTDPSDKRIDLPAELGQWMDRTSRDGFDVVAFTHSDDDHVHGMSSFFHLDHASVYQGEGRAVIRDLWMPAAVLTAAPQNEDARVLQAEARFRLRRGSGIRVFSRPAALITWLAEQGISFANVAHLITDAGQTVPGWSQADQGVEFFVHSPFAVRDDKGVPVDVNTGSIVMQADFAISAVSTKLMLTADTPWENFARIIQASESHGNAERLAWDIFKLSHHCSYKSLGPDKGVEMTIPDPVVARLFEEYADVGGIVVSTSKPIPTDDLDPQPPHRQAANYYKKVIGSNQFIVTMDHPTRISPEPLKITIDHLGATVRKSPVFGGFLAARQPAPRAGASDV